MITNLLNLSYNTKRKRQKNQMIPILSRIVDKDIAIYIYNLLIQDYIYTILVGKIYTNSLIMEKHNKKYHETNVVKNVCYDPYFEYFELIKVCEFLKYTKTHFIDKKLYVYDDDTKEIINYFLNVVGFVSVLEEGSVIKQMQMLYKELRFPPQLKNKNYMLLDPLL